VTIVNTYSQPALLDNSSQIGSAMGRRKYKQLESYDEWLRGGGRLWPYPFDDHDRFLTENDDAAADAYDSDADCCRLRRRRALSTGGHSAS